MTYVRRFRLVMALFAILTALVLVASDADARAGRGIGLGSRATIWTEYATGWRRACSTAPAWTEESQEDARTLYFALC